VEKTLSQDCMLEHSDPLGHGKMGITCAKYFKEVTFKSVFVVQWHLPLCSADGTIWYSMFLILKKLLSNHQSIYCREYTF